MRGNMDIDDIRKDVTVIIESSWINGASDVGTATMLIADYVKELLDKSVDDLKEVGFGWWEDEE